MSIFKKSKIGLGTVQFGLDYGISNNKGKTSELTVKQILSVAYSHGIRVLDTAPDYGVSESTLGSLNAKDLGFRLISKTIDFPGEYIRELDVKYFQEGLKQTLSKLGVSKIDGLLMHYPSDALKRGSGFIFDAMHKEQKRNRIDKIGVSVYNPEELDYVLDNFEIQLVQLPLSAFDQRFIQSGSIDKLYKQGIEIHTRSTFLQGLLLMDPKTASLHFPEIEKKLHSFHENAIDLKLSVMEMCLLFCLTRYEVDTCLVGVNNLQQLNEVIIAEKTSSESLASTIDWSLYSVSDENITNPSMWQL